MFLFVLLFTSTHAIIDLDLSSIPRFPSYDDRRDIHVYAPPSTSSIITSIIEKTLEGNATFFKETTSGDIIMNIQHQNYTGIPQQGTDIPQEDLCPSSCERFGYSLVYNCRDPINDIVTSVTDENSCENTGYAWKDACFDPSGANINETLCQNSLEESCEDASGNFVSFDSQTDCESRGIIVDGIEYKHTFKTRCLSTTPERAVLDMSQCNNVVAKACFNNNVYMPGVESASACEKTGRNWTTECSDGNYATEPLCHFGSYMEVKTTTLYNIEEKSTMSDDNTKDNTDDVVDTKHRPPYTSLDFTYATLPAEPHGAFIAEWTNVNGSTMYLIVYDDDEFEYVYPYGTSCAFAQIKGIKVFVEQNQNIRFHEGYEATSYEYFSPEHDKFKQTMKRINAVSHWNTLGTRHFFNDHVLEFLEDSTNFTVDSNSTNIVCTNFCQDGCQMKYKEFGVFGNPTIRSGTLDDNYITSELGTTLLSDLSLQDTLVVDTTNTIKIQGTMTIRDCNDIQFNENRPINTEATTWDELNLQPLYQADLSYKYYATLKLVCNDPNKVYNFTHVDMYNIQIDVTEFAGSVHFKSSRYNYEHQSSDAILGQTTLVLDNAIFRANFHDDSSTNGYHYTNDRISFKALSFKDSAVRFSSNRIPRRYTNIVETLYPQHIIDINKDFTMVGTDFTLDFENPGSIQTAYGQVGSMKWELNAENIDIKDGIIYGSSPVRASWPLKTTELNARKNINIENCVINTKTTTSFYIVAPEKLVVKNFEIDGIVNLYGREKLELEDVKSTQLNGWSNKSMYMNNIISDEEIWIVDGDLGSSVIHLNNLETKTLRLPCANWALSDVRFSQFQSSCVNKPKGTLDIQSLELGSGEKKLDLKNIDAVIDTKNKAVFNQIKLKNSQLSLFGVRRPWTQEIIFSENAEPYSRLFLGHEVTVLDIQNPEITTEFEIDATTESVQHNYVTELGSISTKIAIPSVLIRNTGDTSHINSVSPTVTVKSVSAMDSSDIEYIELQDYVGLDVEDKRQYCEPGYQTTENGCDACPKGTYSSRFDSGACIDCPKGLYNDETGQRVCKRCPTDATSGYTRKTKITKSESASDCEVTTICSAGLYFYDLGCHTAQKCGTITDAQRFKENKKCKCGDEIIEHDEYCIDSIKSVIPLCSTVNNQAPCVGAGVSVDESSNEPKVQTGCPASDQLFIGNPKSSRFNLNNIIVVGDKFACECGSNKCTAGQFCHDDNECRDLPQCKNNAFVSEDCFCKTTQCAPGNVCIDGKCQESCDNVLSTARDKSLVDIVSSFSKYFASMYTGQDIQKWVRHHGAQRDTYLEKFEDATDTEHLEIWANTESNINAPLHPFHYQMEDFILDRLRYDFNFYSERLTSEDLITEVFSYFYDSDTVAAVKSGKCHSGICFSASKGLSRSNFAVYEQLDSISRVRKLLDTPFQRMFPEYVPMYKSIEACCGLRTYESDPFECDEAVTNATCGEKSGYAWQQAFVETPSRLRNPLDASWNQHNVPTIERNIPTFINGRVMTKGEYVYTVWFAYIDTLQRYIESTYIGSRPYVTQKCMCHTDSFDKVQGCSTTQYCQHGRCRFTPLDDCAYTRGMAVNQNECICGNTACDLNNYCVKATSTCLQESVASIE